MKQLPVKGEHPGRGKNLRRRPHPGTEPRSQEPGEHQRAGEEKQFRLLFEQAVDGIFVADAGGRYLDVNRAGCDMMGYSREEILARTISDLIAPEERVRMAPHVAEFAGGKVTRSEWRFVRKDGSVFIGEVVSRQLPDGRLQAFVRDISERKQTEDAERRARNRSELLSRMIGRLLAAPDPQTVVEELCNEVREFLGCDVFFNFLLDGGTRRLLFNACGGVDVRLARKVESLELGQSLCGTAARDGCRVHAEGLGTSEDPRSALVRSLGIRAYACHPLMGPENEVMGTLSFGARDRDRFSAEDLDLMKAVTDHVAVAMLRRRSEQARAEAEDRLRTVLRAAGVGLWLHDLSLRRLNWDARTRELFFLQPGEEPSLELFRNRLHPADRDALWEEAERAVGEDRMFARDLRVVDPATGRVRWIHAEGRGVRDESGKVVRFEGVNYDVTERREFQAELERLVEERTGRLQEMVGELEHFSYTITHDLKAPLRAMRGFAEVASQTCLKTETKLFLEKISAAAERMDLLIRDALNYSQAVRRELPLEDVDTTVLLRGILDSYPQFQPWKAQIRVQGPLPVVLGNEAGLTQCFSNLLGNAVKFVEPGQIPDVRVYAEEPADRQGWVRIWVEDQGIGIPREMLPRLFNMFSRGNKDYEGTGIGLALVRKVVQRMGGRVGVESQEGKGSRFWMELKRGRVPQPGAPRASTGASEGKGGTVLYVEDEESDVMFMEMAFEAKAMETALQTVTDGRTAIEYLSGSGQYADRKKFPVPSVVLLDLNLPLVSGFEVLEWMRNHPDFARTPVVVFSSSTLDEDRAKARQFGANEFLVKPGSGLEFGGVVEQLKGRWLSADPSPR